MEVMANKMEVMARPQAPGGLPGQAPSCTGHKRPEPSPEPGQNRAADSQTLACGPRPAHSLLAERVCLCVRCYPACCAQGAA